MTGAPARPVHDAARAGDIAKLVRLIDQDVKRLNERSHDGSTPLMIACMNNQAQVVRVLLERGADSNLTNNRGTNALIEASLRGFLDIARLLVEGGADVGAVDGFQQTALHYAAIHGNRDVAAFLLDNGALIEARNRRGQTPLLNAALGGFHDVFDLLVERGADRNAVSETGNNLMMCVTKGGNLQLFDQVFNLHPELLNVATEENWNLLMTAALNCHPEIVERILSFNPDVNARVLDGRHALFFAATVDLERLVQQENRVDLERPPREEVERRIAALQERRLAVIRLLLQNGARKDIENEDGRTALEVATDEEVRELLRD